MLKNILYPSIYNNLKRSCGLVRTKVVIVEKKHIKTIKLPPLGDSIEEATIVKLPLVYGEWVRIDTPMMIVDSGKAILPINSPFNGKFMGYTTHIDDDVEIDNDIYKIVEGDADDDNWYVDIDEDRFQA